MTVSKSDYKRLFLQAMMQRRWASEATVKLLFLKCMEATQEINPTLNTPYTEREFAVDNGKSFVGEINQDVNTKQDAATMLATEYNATEIQYFKLIVEQIMLADNEAYSIPATAALREVSQLQGKAITKAEAEHLLSSLVAKGWLMKSKRGRYSLALRSLLELQTYLRETYPDEYQECTNCLEPMTKGVACRTNNCAARMHLHCYTAWVRAQRERALLCPQCGSSWKEDAVRKIGEDGVRGEHVHRRASRGAEEEPEEEEIEMEVEGGAEPSEEEMEVNAGKGKGKKAKSRRAPATQQSEPDPSQAKSTKRASRRK
ncbi:Nse1 non-SMC component of SMC5-6 complex protein [Ceratobasidium theobromae]|uniref:Non-structural maintenance of chromosomes element 1 homolog n=1 Tax=Ceratobasidium theobromae TaxID=1582974 RepID=A0A5N5QY98_9AGAM|nr:Nse1 non-SMC component of SMC5-6 complex protein [Ceratobasidium theobromae]